MRISQAPIVPFTTHADAFTPYVGYLDVSASQTSADIGLFSVPAFELSPSFLSEAASPHCGWSFLKPFQVRKLLTSSPTNVNYEKGTIQMF